jgi:hypothetical protein
MVQRVGELAFACHENPGLRNRAPQGWVGFQGDSDRPSRRVADSGTQRQSVVTQQDFLSQGAVFHLARTSLITLFP